MFNLACWVNQLGFDFDPFLVGSGDPNLKTFIWGQTGSTTRISPQRFLSFPFRMWDLHLSLGHIHFIPTCLYTCQLAILVSDLVNPTSWPRPLCHAYSDKLRHWIAVRDCWRCVYFEWSKFTRVTGAFEIHMWPTDPTREPRWGWRVGKKSDWKVDSSLWFLQIDGRGWEILDSYS